MHGRRPIGPVDTMWLNMDRPNILRVIDSVMWFEGTIDWELLGPLLQRRLVDRYPVFSQRPVPASIPFGMPQWDDDPDFSLSRHLRRTTLPPPGNEDALQRYVESRMSVPFDRAYPLWEMTLVEGYGGGCALVSRFHHSIADGIALSQVLLSLTTSSPSADLGEVEAQESSIQHLGASWAWRGRWGTRGYRQCEVACVPCPGSPSWPTRRWPRTSWSSVGGPARSPTSCCWATTRRLRSRASQELTSGQSGLVRERLTTSSAWAGSPAPPQRRARGGGFGRGQHLPAGPGCRSGRPHHHGPGQCASPGPTAAARIGQPVRPGLSEAAHRAVASTAARGREQETDGLHQDLPRGAHHVRPEYVDRAR